MTVEVQEEVKIKEMNENYRKPLIIQRADPFIYKHEDGYYYFIASVPSYDRIELRRSRTIAGLAYATPRTIWRKHETGEMSKLIWAPEIHYIAGNGISILLQRIQKRLLMDCSLIECIV